jgi:biopolymer transport protein ExbD
MVDIMIVLLIIFMVATPFLDRPPVALPMARHTSARPADELRVVVHADGLVTLGEDVLPGLEALEVGLRGRVQRHGDLPAVRIEADGTASYGRVSAALAACRAAGITRVGLAARPRTD